MSDDPAPEPAADGFDDEELVEFDLSDLDDDFLDDLEARLDEAGIPLGWDDGPLLVVRAVDAAATEDLIDALEHPDALEVLGDGDDAGVEALSAWFVAADQLVRDPSKVSAVVPLVDALDATHADRPPFGIEPELWSGIHQLAAELRRAVAEERRADEVRELAGRLRAAVRPMV